MTEPESEAESLSSDGEGNANLFKVYYNELLDVEIPAMKVKCRGCSKKFPFQKEAGVKMSESPQVRAFYEHCLTSCPPYITAGTVDNHCLSMIPVLNVSFDSTGDMKTCIPCKLYFMNQETFDHHKPECIKNQKKQVSTGKGGKVPPPPSPSRSRVGPSSRTRRVAGSDVAKEAEEQENEGDKMVKELLNANFNKIVEEEKAKQKAASAGHRKQIQDTSSSEDENKNSNKVSRPTPSASAAAQVLAGRKLSGKDLSQLTTALKKRNSKTPSALARKKEEKKQRREEKRKKRGSATSRLSESSDESSSGSSSDGEGGEKRTNKRKRRKREYSEEGEESRNKRREERRKKAEKKRKKKKPFDPEKSIYRTFDTSSSELDPDEEEFPESILTLPDATLQPHEYYNHIPKGSLSCARFNDSIKCPGCQERFPCYRPHLEPGSTRRKENEIPAPTYYKHCLRECIKYQKMALMRRCDDCCHRFLDFRSYLQHRKGGKGSQCNVLKKTKVEPLKYKWPTMARDSFLRALEIGQKKKNAKMNCPGCQTTYKCYRRGHEYIPDLVMFMHCVTDCVAYQKLGLVVTCPTCECVFMDQSWLDVHECDKAAPSVSSKPKRPPPIGGKTVPEQSSRPPPPTRTEKGAGDEKQKKEKKQQESSSSSDDD